MVDRSTSSGWNLRQTYTNLPQLFFTRLEPEPVADPKLVLLNENLARELGLEPAALRQTRGVEVFAGNQLPPNSDPLAQAYAGHQFGHFTMLGDGRAILLGEQVTAGGTTVDVQLKGSGPTPYSRSGDGRAALGPMLREYIVSEAMHSLGIPTTRGLAVVTTGQPIYRETALPGAVLTRTATSHLRVGTFQFAAAWGEPDDLIALADYALQRHFPEIDRQSPRRFQQLLHAVLDRQAYLIAQWQLVGFIHGVMNTDNMTISGETIDYGPCAFMDVYDPKTVFSSIDRQGRYAYGNQPRMAAWNLARFAETLLPLFSSEEEEALEKAQEIIGGFPGLYQTYWLAGMRKKLGLFNEEEKDLELARQLRELMAQTGADYTNTFRALTLQGKPQVEGTLDDAWQDWLDKWQSRLQRQPQSKAEVRQLMQQANPAIIPRNFQVEEALAAAVERGDLAPVGQLLAALDQPYAYSPQQEAYAVAPEPGVPYQTFCGT